MKFSVPVFLIKSDPETLLDSVDQILVSRYDHGDSFGYGPTLHSTTVDFELTTEQEEAARIAQINTLKDMKQKVYAAAESKIQELDGHIQSLLAITHKE